MPKSNEPLKLAQDRLADAVESIVSRDDWKRMLKVASKFHRYSFNNHQMDRTRSVLLRRLRCRAEGGPSAEGQDRSNTMNRAGSPWSPDSIGECSIKPAFLHAVMAS